MAEEIYTELNDGEKGLNHRKKGQWIKGSNPTKSTDRANVNQAKTVINKKGEVDCLPFP